MKETTCPLCGGRIGVGDETAYGQHVLCPYCGGKFSYLAENAGLSPEHLSEPTSHGRAPKKKRGNSGLLLVAACFFAVLIMGSILAILLLPSIIDSFAKPHQTPVHCVISELPSEPVRGNDVQEVRSAVCETPVAKEISVSNVVLRPTPVNVPKMVPFPAIPQAEETKQAEVLRIDDRHEIALNAFAGRTLLFWEDLRDRERPNVSAETCYCAVADGTKTFALYAMEGASMGVSNRILRLVRGKQPQEVPEGEFKRACKDAVVVYANGESAVIRGYCARKPMPFAIPKENESISVGALAFGDVLPFLESLGVDMSGTEYAVSVTVRRSEIEVSQLGVADHIGREPIEKAVREHLLKNKIDRALAGIHLKPPRITVREYGGDQIVKYKDVTLIPANPNYEEQIASIQCTGVRYTVWNNRNWESARCNCDGCKRKRELMKQQKKWEKLKAQATEESLQMKEYETKRDQRTKEIRRSISISNYELELALSCAKGSIRRIADD